MARNYYNLYKAMGVKKFVGLFIAFIAVYAIFIVVIFGSGFITKENIFLYAFNSVSNFVVENPVKVIVGINMFIGLLIFLIMRSNLRKKDRSYYKITGRKQKLTPDGQQESFSCRSFLFFANLILFLILIICPIFVFIHLLLWQWYVNCFFQSKNFNIKKQKIDANTREWNELNDHIENLRNSFERYTKKYHGSSSYEDLSLFNYSRKHLRDHTENPYVYSCSLQIIKNSREKPFWYLCKYFNFDKNEKTLNMIEKSLNDYASAEQGKIILLNKREEILMEIYHDIPFLIRRYKKLRLFDSLGFDLFDKDFEYYPVYSFDYVSAGGNSHQRNNIELDVEGMEDFAIWLDGEVKYKKSIKAQRSLMTQDLREFIKKRDNYTCQNCGNSISKEPNLLLEIDHIQPISKGGLTCIENLQTLCWKCNRSKGSKINAATMKTEAKQAKPKKPEANINKTKEPEDVTYGRY